MKLLRYSDILKKICYNVLMKTYKTCCVIGHREFSPSFEEKEKLESLFENLISNCLVETFYFGGHGEFDNFYYDNITEKKKKYPYITRVYVTEDYRDIRNVARRVRFYDFFEEVEYFPLKNDYWMKRLYFRNIEMIDNSDFVIFYTNANKSSGSYKAYKHAEKKKMKFDTKVSDTSKIILAFRD